MTRRAWLAFAAMSVLWGVSYLLIEIAERGGFTAPDVAWLRTALAAAALIVVSARGGRLGELRGRGRWLLAYAVAEVCIPFTLISLGEVHVASSVTAIIIATVPLIGAALALRFDATERPTPVRGLGLALGFAGVVALVGIDVAGDRAELLSAVGIVIAAAGYAIGPMLIKLRLGGCDPRPLMGGSLTIAAVLLAAPAALDTPSRVPTAGAWLALIALGLVCTAVAFVVFAVLIREAGTSRATVITYVNPVVALALGVWLEGEHPGAGAIVGLVLILAGSWLSTSGRLGPPRSLFGARRGRAEGVVMAQSPVDRLLD